MNISVYPDRAVIGTFAFSEPPLIDDLIKVLGDATVHMPLVTAAKSTIYTFNAHGIWAYAESGLVGQISLLLTVPYLSFHPSTPFIGQISICDLPIRSADDFLAVPAIDKDLDEWEAEGFLSIGLGKFECSLYQLSDPNELVDICFWFSD